MTSMHLAMMAAVGLIAPSEGCPTDAPSQPAPFKCAAAAPTVGEPFAGPVLNVIAGDTLCVALGPEPSQWVLVRLADGDAREPAERLRRSVFGRRIACVASIIDGESVVAHCALGASSVATLAQGGR